MPIDPNIPLQAGNPSGPFGPDMNQVWNSYNQAYRGQLQQNDLAGQNALRNVFQNKNALDPNTGLPLTSALAPVGQANPQTYLDTLGIISKIQEQQQHSAITTMLGNQKLVQSWDSFVVGPLSQLYTKLQSQNIPDDQKNLIIGQEQKKLTDQWQAENGITDSQRARFDKPFNPTMMAQSQAFQKRTDEMEKHWVHHEDGNGVPYWTNDYLGLTVNEARSAPYQPVGGAPPKAGLKPEERVDILPDGTKVPMTYDPLKDKYFKRDPGNPDSPGTPYTPVNPHKLGTEGTQRPRELTSASLMEAQVKNPDNTFSPRTVRQEVNPDGSLKTIYADGPEAGQEVPIDKIKPDSIRAKGTPASQEGIDATAEAIATYRQPPLSSYAMRSGSGPDIMAAVKKLNPNYNAQKYAEANSIRQDFARGPTSRRVDALNTAIQHLDVFNQLEENLKANKGTPDVPMVNAVINYAQTQAGHPEVTSFDVAKDVIADEIMKTIISGGGALTDRAGLQSKLRASASSPQINEATDRLKQLMGGAMGALERRWTSGGILTKDEFREKMNPETLAALDKYLPKSQRGEEAAKEPPVQHTTLDDAKAALSGRTPGKDYPIHLKDKESGKTLGTTWFHLNPDGSVKEIPP